MNSNRLNCFQLKIIKFEIICIVIKSKIPVEISISERRLNTGCGWFYPAANSSASGRMQVVAVSSPGGWIQVTADSILRVTKILAARHKLRLTPSNGWLEFRWLDTSCGWLCPTADLSSSSQIKVTADSILWLTQVPAAGNDSRLIPSCGWLEFWRLDMSCNWSHPVAGYELRLTRVLLARLDLRLFYTLIYLSSKFKDLSCKIHHSYGLFFTAWFQLPLIQALPAASRTLKRHEEVSRL